MEYAPSSRRIAFAVASASGASSLARSAATSSLSDVVASLTPVGAQLLAQLADVDEVAVVPERDRARAAVVEQRLRVRPRRRAGRRVARVADRDLAAQAVELLLVEHLRDEAEVAHPREATALGDGDSRRLLAAVLEREEAEVREPRDVVAGRVHAEDSAHAGNNSDLAEPARAEPVEALGRAREDRRAAARLVVGRNLDVRLEPAAPRRGLGERAANPGAADVVAEREVRRRLPEEADERRLCLERAVGRLGEEHDVAALPSARATAARRRRVRRNRRPASAGSRRRRRRCRARRCRRRRGSRALPRRWRSPRSPARARARSRASRGCRS